MKLRVLGSAAGGGYPQWNCGCPNCIEARSGSSRTRPRTQESVALSADGDSWFLLNASPEVRAQIESFPPLHPRASRHSPIAGIVLTNGDLDHCLGLLSLRESHALCVYATGAVRRGFSEGNAFYRTLQRFAGQIRWIDLELGVPAPLACSDGRASGLSIEAIAAPGKLPIHLERTQTPSAEDNIGIVVRQAGSARTLAYFPAVAGPAPGVMSALAASSCAFFDGTFWSSDELIALGLGDKRAEQMAHWPVGGTDGSLLQLAALVDNSAPRRVLIHVNNTNPLLIEDSAQAAQLRAAQVELAYDGMELEL